MVADAVIVVAKDVVFIRVVNKMEKKKNKRLNSGEFTFKQYMIMVVIFLVLWQVPLLFLDLGVISAGLLPVLAFLIAYWATKSFVGNFKNREESIEIGIEKLNIKPKIISPYWIHVGSLISYIEKLNKGLPKDERITKTIARIYAFVSNASTMILFFGAFSILFAPLIFVFIGRTDVGQQVVLWAGFLTTLLLSLTFFISGFIALRYHLYFSLSPSVYVKEAKRNRIGYVYARIGKSGKIAGSILLGMATILLAISLLFLYVILK